MRVLQPYLGLHKVEVLRRGRGLPLELTFSCIRPRRGPALRGVQQVRRAPPGLRRGRPARIGPRTTRSDHVQRDAGNPLLLRPPAARLRRQVPPAARPQRPGRHHAGGRRPSTGSAWSWTSAGSSASSAAGSTRRSTTRCCCTRTIPALPFLRRLGEPVHVLDVNPTAENIARLIFDYTASQGFPVVEVRLWETESCFAAYSGETS